MERIIEDKRKWKRVDIIEYVEYKLEVCQRKLGRGRQRKFLEMYSLDFLCEETFFGWSLVFFFVFFGTFIDFK